MGEYGFGERVHVIEGLYKRIMAYEKVNPDSNGRLSAVLIGANGEKSQNMKELADTIISLSIGRGQSAEHFLDLAFFENRGPEYIAAKLRGEDEQKDKFPKQCSSGFREYMVPLNA